MADNKKQVDDSKLKIIGNIAEFLNKNSLTPKYFVDVIKRLTDHIEKKEKESSDSINSLKTRVDKHEYILSDIPKIIKNKYSELNEKIENTQSSVSKIKRIKGDPGNAGKDSKPEDVAYKLKNDPEFIEMTRGNDGSPDMAEDVRNKLELLDGEDRLSMSAIHGLSEALENIGKIRHGNIVSSSGRGHIKNFDLSNSLDGNTTTFNLPANWTIIQVVASSFPSVLRPVIDYTFTTTSITFTSQINPATTLAVGQTVIVIYEDS